MAHTYSHLFGIPATGLRFFTVYGPWGRPDMAPFLFTKAIIEGKSIDVFNNGDMERDFTYIDDIVEGVVRVIDRPPREQPCLERRRRLTRGARGRPTRSTTSGTARRSSSSISSALLEKKLGKKAVKNFLPMQPGDVHATYADVDDLVEGHRLCSVDALETGSGTFCRLVP